MELRNNCSNGNRKVLVLGYDAATFDIIKPMIEKGKLPNFKKMMSEGSYGDLQSTFPPVTPPAWASFMTGKNPGKHGVYNFYYHSLDPSKDDENYFVNSLSIKSNTLWEIFSQKGKKNIVVNVPVTYPITNNIDGIMISGLLTPNHAEDFIQPPELKEELDRNVSNYRPDLHPTTDWSSKSLKERLDHYIEVELERTKTALYLLENHPWDFFMVMFSFTDKILHLVYPHMNKDYPESEELREYIFKTYEVADEMLGRFLSAVGEETSVFVVSDHGFGHLEKVFVSNRWLVDNEFMNLKKANALNFRDLYQFKFKKTSIEKILMKLNLEPVRRMLPPAIKAKLLTIPRLHKRVSRSVVDWSSTKAYGSDYGIRINLKGREVCGTVQPGEEYERVRDDIIKKLYELRDPQSGEKLVDHVWKREELFSGEYSENSPDIMYIIKDMNYVQYDLYYFNSLFRKVDHGTHRMNGILLMKGEGIKKGNEIRDANIVDVAPTILYSAGLPIQDDMDGSLLSSAFQEDGLESRPVHHEEALPFMVKETDERSVYSAEEEEEIKIGLKGLGYWG